MSGSKLHDMLGDPYYVGFVVYKGDIYPGRHEPIITPELFERVQEVMKARSGRGQRDRVHHHYLKGFLFCDRCHRQERTSRLIFAEVTGRGGAKYQYFVCRGREDGLCNLPHLRVELVEQAIIEHYETLALPGDFVSELRSLLDETLADETTSVKERHAALQRQLKKLDQQEDRLVMALADDTMPTVGVQEDFVDVVPLVLPGTGVEPAVRLTTTDVAAVDVHTVLEVLRQTGHGVAAASGHLQEDELRGVHLVAVGGGRETEVGEVRVEHWFCLSE